MYRIVQEALTNCVRHAGAARSSVRLDYDADTCGSTSATTGSAPAAIPPPAGGHGLVAMRERVALVGGKLDAGRGRTRLDVRAELPLEPDRDA